MERLTVKEMEKLNMEAMHDRMSSPIVEATAKLDYSDPEWLGSGCGGHYADEEIRRTKIIVQG